MTTGDENNNVNNGVDNQSNADLEAIKAEKEALNAELEKIKNELKSRDVALNKIAKEKQEKELANKTAEEQAELLRKQVKQYEQKEAFRQSFKEVGLDPDDFQEIVNESDPKAQAQKFAELLKSQTAKSAELALESYKKETLDKIAQEPKPQGGAGDSTDYQAIFSKVQKTMR